MIVNDPSDPQIAILFDRMEEYRQVSNFGPDKVDATRALALYKRDETFTGFDPAPPVGGFIGWDAYWKAYHEIFDKYRVVRFNYNDDLRILRKGEVAWVSLSATISGISRDGADFHKDIRGTMVWLLHEGTWLVTQEHWSAPREIPLASGEIV